MSAAPNVRLVDPLKGDATRYARNLGVSLNALVAVAVRDYLDARAPQAAAQATAAAAAAPAPDASAVVVAKPRTPTTAAVIAAKVGRNEPCPCGSGKKFKQCHGGAR
jgi:preprotein translocase subunit SecA